MALILPVLHAFQKVTILFLSPPLPSTVSFEANSFLITNYHWLLLSLGVTTNPASSATPLSRRQLGESCTVNADCSATYSKCNEGTCACEVGSIQQGIDCFLVIGMSCVEPEACASVRNADCIRDQCTCFYGYIFNGTSCVPRQLGDSCVHHSDCTNTIDGSMCTASKCTCRYGMAFNTQCALRRMYHFQHPFTAFKYALFIISIYNIYSWGQLCFWWGLYHF